MTVVAVVELLLSKNSPGRWPYGVLRFVTSYIEIITPFKFPPLEAINDHQMVL